MPSLGRPAESQAQAAPPPDGGPAEGQLLTVDQDGTINIRASMLYSSGGRGGSSRTGSLGACVCSLGIAATRPADSNPALSISAEESAAVGRYGRLCGESIFDTEKRNANGGLEYTREADGVQQLLMDSSNLRKQVPLDAEGSLMRMGQAHGDSRFADELVRVYGREASMERAAVDERTVLRLKWRLEPAAKRLAIHCAQQLTGQVNIDGDGLLKQCVALVNDWNEDRNGVLRSCPQEAPHCDLGEADSHVLIWATDSVQLLWWPLTHCAIQAEQACSNMAEQDRQLFLNHILPSRYPCVRLWLERDDVVVLRGTTGYAGAAGVPGKPAGCIHWHAVPRHIGNLILPLAASCLHEKVHVPSRSAGQATELRDGPNSNSGSPAVPGEVMDTEEQAALVR